MHRQLRCEFSKALLGVKEVFSRHETSHDARGKVVATNNLIKTFCQKYTTLVQFFEHNIKSIIAGVGCFPRSYHIYY